MLCNCAIYYADKRLKVRLMLYNVALFESLTFTVIAFCNKCRNYKMCHAHFMLCHSAWNTRFM